MEQAPEVEPVGLDESVTILPKEGRQPFWSGGERGRRALAAVGFREEPVDEVQQVGPIRRQASVAVRQIIDHLFKDGDPVFVLGEKKEVRPDSQVAPVLSQDVCRECVKGGKLGTVGVFAKAPVHPVPHLGGGLVGESQGQRRGVLVLFQQPDHPQREHHGLAGTGSREHQERPFAPLHGPPLVRVEVVEGDHRLAALRQSYDLLQHVADLGGHASGTTIFHRDGNFGGSPSLGAIG